MRLFTRFAILFYVAVISIVCGCIILFATRTIQLDEVFHYLILIYEDPVINLITIGSSLLVVLFSFLFARIVYGSQQKEKNIAFDNPSGRVSVSLGAVEDLVRRMIQKVEEVKEVRPSIIASKKGIEIESRLVLRSDVNIPQMTSRLQDMVKNKIQEILGIEESVHVRIHIVKIINEQPKAKAKKKIEEKKEEEEPAVPFQGYRN